MAAFESAVGVRRAGGRGLRGLGFLLTRLQAQGERYCPLALEQFLSEVDEDDRPDAVDPGPVRRDRRVFDPQFSGEFSFDGVPGEPFEEVP